MSTWNSVTIRAVVPIETLPDIEDFSLIHEEGWGHAGAGQSPLKNEDGSYQRDEHGVVIYGERTPDTSTYFAGESKYRRDEIGEWCIEWTATNPGIPVEWSQTWDDDGQGESLSVYRDGVYVRAESKHSTLTPIDLDDLIADVRAALPTGGRIADLDGTDDAADWITVGHVLDAYEVEYLRSLSIAKPSLADSARTLVDALSPEVAR